MSYMPWPEFGSLFRQFKSYTFRLETLPQYLVPSFDSDWEAYKRGEPLQILSEEYQDWLQMIRDTVAAGKSISRVHLWPENISPYLRYEVEWGYVHNVAAGDDVRILLPSAPKEVRAICKEDFWLFDDHLVVIVDYEKDGTVIGAREMVERAKIPEYIETMHLTLQSATPLKEYLRMVRMGELCA